MNERRARQNSRVDYPRSRKQMPIYMLQLLDPAAVCGCGCRLSDCLQAVMRLNDLEAASGR